MSADRDPRGRRPAPEAARKMARALHNAGLSLRKIAAQLPEQGFLAPSGKPYHPQSISWMLETKQ
jgi:hypothetical protein